LNSRAVDAPTSLDRLDTLAKIGASLLGVQFDAVKIEAADIAGDAWVFGYCFGLFDAMAQYAKLDQSTEAAPMISAGFGKLVNDIPRGKDLFKQAVTRLDEPAFNEGYDGGGIDLLAWAADADALPTGIARRSKRD
jgi:hypothetical protein